ncbi:MAG: hypothetical protein AB2599_16920 [Candidatus Thiodiazotropha sp.]
MISFGVIFWPGLVLLLIISLAIGLYNKSSDSSEWMSAGRKVKTLQLTASIIGTMVGGALFVAVVLLGYDIGIVGIYIGIAYIIGLILLGLLSKRITHLLDETQSESIYHFIVNKLGTKVGRLYSLINAVLFIFAVAGQILAMYHFFLNVPGISHPQIAIIAAILLTVIVVTIYIYTGGLRKDIVSDVFQLIYIVIGLAFFIPHILDLPLHSYFVSLDPKLYTVGYYGLGWAVAALFLIMPMLFVRADLWQRIRAAESPSVARNAFLISAPIVGISFCLFIIVGMIARGAAISKDTNLIMELATLNTSTPTSDWLIPLLALSFIGAIISSLDSLLNVSSIASVRFTNPGENTVEEQSTSLNALQKAAFIAALLVILLLVFFSNIVDIFVGAISFVMVLSLPILLILLDYNPHKNGAFYSIAVGAAVLIIAWFFIPKYAFIPAVILGWITYPAIIFFEKLSSKNN